MCYASTCVRLLPITMSGQPIKTSPTDRILIMSPLEAVPDVPLILHAIVTAPANDVVMACRRFLHYWSFLRRIHWCTPIMNSQGCGSLTLFAVTLLQLLNKQSVESLLIQTSLGSFDVTIIKINASVVKILLHMQFDLMKHCSIFFNPWWRKLQQSGAWYHQQNIRDRNCIYFSFPCFYFKKNVLIS